MTMDLKLTQEEAETLYQTFNKNYSEIVKLFPDQRLQLSILFNAFRANNKIEAAPDMESKLSKISKIIGQPIDNDYDSGAINYSTLLKIYESNLYTEEEEEVIYYDIDELMDLCNSLDCMTDIELDEFMNFNWSTSWEEFYIESFSLDMTVLSDEEAISVMKCLLMCEMVKKSDVEETDDDHLIISSC